VDFRKLHPRRRRQQGCLHRLPAAKGLALVHDLFSRSDPLQSQVSGQISGLLWTRPAVIYALQALSGGLHVIAESKLLAANEPSLALRS
jgi:hypothetical protein